MDVDVVVVGAGIAGCTSAILYGRAGLRVALLEKHRNPATHKVLCGHFIQGGTEQMLRRTGFWDAMVDAGGAVQRMSVWGDGNWSTPPDEAPVPSAISLRRERLDPLLRSMAAGTPGVTMLLGEAVTGLVERDGRVVGVRTAEREVRARLVVGADGYRSGIAALAGARPRHSPNERFGYWAYYRGVKPRGPVRPGHAQIWRLEPDVGILVRTDDELTLLAAFPAKTQLPEFRPDPGAALERFLSKLPDAPDLSAAQRESKVVGTTDYPCVRHDPTPRSGLVLVGDAATTSDPTPAPGCGWAFRSADWLVEASAADLAAGNDLRPAMRRYRRSLRFIEDHDRMMRSEALAQPPSRLARMVTRAASVDPVIGVRLYRFANRDIATSELLNPATLVRAFRLTRRMSG